jgi:DNA-binding response OmpR family regulator
VISARQGPSERAMAVGAGADAFLGKPFPLADLVTTVDRLIDRS